MKEKLKMLCNLYDKANGDVDVDALLKVCFIRNLDAIVYYFYEKGIKVYITYASVYGNNKISMEEKEIRLLKYIVETLKETDEFYR